jgi:putative transposase
MKYQMRNRKFIEKGKIREEVLIKYYQQGLSNRKIAELMKCSVRTIIRWKKKQKNPDSIVHQVRKNKRERQRRFDPQIFERIIALKEEMPSRSAVLVHKLLKIENPSNCSSESTIRKYLISKGFKFKEIHNREGYIKFERSKPNDLWQIDIAGVQTIVNVGKVYLIALIDDCSRFVVAAQYFMAQDSSNVMKVIRSAVMTYGCPNQIIADNGTQFKNTIGELNTRYKHLLMLLEIKPIFSRRNHPQSKGKLERWFGTIIQSFLPEVRLLAKNSHDFTLADVNLELCKWLKWYNEEKSHRSLIHRVAPAKIYHESPTRIFRPLKVQVNWNEWINTYLQRKVTKYNSISYKAQNIQLPAGYMGCNVDLLELDDRIEIYHQEKLICTHSRNPDSYLPSKKGMYRSIAQNGTIQYKRKWHTIDYKLAGKKVEIQESTDGTVLLVYLDRILLKQIPLQ